jgi:N-acetylneuraminic acid mutarotase
MKNLNRLFLLVLLLPVAALFSGCSTSTDWGDWVSVSDFSGATRGDAVSFVIGDKGYVFGGYNGKIRFSDLWMFDSQNDTWTEMADLATFGGAARNSASAFAIGTNGYIGLGFDGNDYLKDFWQYNSLTNTWVRKADFGGTARYGAIAFALDGKGYMGTGYDDNYLNDIYRYDPTADTWTQTSNLNNKRVNAAAFVYNDEAYVLGGSKDGATVPEFQKFTPSTQTWSSTKPGEGLASISDATSQGFDDNYDNLAREYPCVFVIASKEGPDKAYMTCGQRGGTLLNDTWEYNFATDRWKTTTVFQGTTRAAAVSLNVDGRGLVLTGRNSSYRFDDVWEFLPKQKNDATHH